MSTYPFIRRLVLLAALAVLCVPAAALGAGADDYPAEFRHGDPATQSDRWGYAVRTAPSFIAWRLEQNGILASSNYGWGVLVQSGWSVAMLTDYAAQVGGRLDQSPSPNSIALWPGEGWWSHTEWVLAVSADGSTINETFQPGSGYVQVAGQRAPYYVHLPAPGQIPPSVRVPGSGGGNGTAPLVRGPRIGRVTAKGRLVRAKLNLRRSGVVRITLRRGRVTVKATRRVPAGPRTVRMRLSGKVARGRYRLIVRAPGDRAGRTLRVSRLVSVR